MPATGRFLPRLRFPEFGDEREWKIQPLGEVCEILNSRRIPITTKDRNAGPFPYYGASGIVDYVDDFIFDERLVLVGEDGAKWQAFEETAFLAEGRYWVNNHAHVLKSTDLIDTLLVGYLVRSSLGGYVTGAAPPKLTLGKLKRIPIPVPPTDAEQQKIADCLGSLDDLIAAEGRKLAALREHKKALMQQLFPREGETRPRLRFPEFQDAGAWEEQPFEALYDFKPNNTYSRDRLNYDEGEVKNIHYGDIHTRFATHFHVNAEKVPFVNPEVVPEDPNPESFCRPGDVIFADASEDLADVGKCIEIIEVGDEHVLSGSHTILARPRSSSIAVGFAGYLFKSRCFRNGIEKEAQGTKVMQISPKRLAKVEVLFPPNEHEQTTIADCLSSLDALIAAQAAKLDGLRTHKRGLMQQLFPLPSQVEY